ncbi:calcium-binding protein [uncultured Tateyamaria sp.]|uniref:calcium-binding protein n=1 Tax=Tateyamaria sp. 1078 TaxID=3417464 RepID=UPI002617F8D7|nr:calcium-binding protein [uncultured Tateyamaria sp.]
MPEPTANISLETIATLTEMDPGLRANISDADIQGGADAARQMNEVIEAAMAATGVNADGKLSVADLRTLSAYIRGNADLFETFLIGHGDDEGNAETGFHLVQGDGGTFQFQGRGFINTVADAIYHVGFRIVDGRFQNEDGNQNETVADVAGWMNYFVNGENRVYGTNAGETLFSGTYSDAVIDAADEIFEAEGGNDKIWAGIGDDIVYGGTGHDVTGGGDGDDHLMGEGGHDKLWGEAGDDTLEGGRGDDTLGGGDGDDSASGGAGRDQVWGQGGDDMLWGGTHADTLGGGTGDDSLWGGGGRDKIWGEEGDDVIDAGAGRDTVGGGNGDDRITLGDGNDVGYGEGGDDDIAAGAGRDTVWAHTGDDTVTGGAGNDKIGGGDGADALSGDAGDDTLFGENDADTLDGGDGRDDLVGGNGADVFIGGAGGDILKDWEAGDSRDVFVFAQGDSGLDRKSTDVILGFDSGVDRIDLSAFGGLDYVGEADFSGSGAEVRFDGDYVQIDHDGDGQADERIELRWVQEVVAGDFIL